MASGERIGEVKHYFDRIGVAVLQLTQTLKAGEKVHFLGRHTDFEQVIASMEVEHKGVAEAPGGTEAAVKVQQRVRPGDAIFRP
jgi:putative protease